MNRVITFIICCSIIVLVSIKSFSGINQVNSSSTMVSTFTNLVLSPIPSFSPGKNTRVNVIFNTNGLPPILTNMTVNIIEYQGSTARFSISSFIPTTNPPVSRVVEKSLKLPIVPVPPIISPIAYQWYRSDGSIINGATKSTLILTNIQPLDRGLYYVSAINSYGESVAVSSLFILYTNILPACLTTNSITIGFGWSYDFINNPIVVGFNLYQGHSSGNYTSFISIDTDITNFYLPVMMDGSKYYFSLTAKDINNVESTNSSELLFVSSLPILEQFNPSILMLTTGVPRIQMQVCPFQVVTINYSTNFTTWIPLRSLTSDKYGNVSWDDTDPKRTSFRFYNVTTTTQ